MNETFHYGEDRLTAGLATKLATKEVRGIINNSARERINNNRNCIDRIIQNHRVVYGVTTGFGILADKIISEEDTTLLQYKLLQSHSVGVGG